MSIYSSDIYLMDLEQTIRNTVSANDLKGKRILITGATGTIGSYLVDALLQFNKTAEAGIEVYAAGRNIQKMENRFREMASFGLRYVSYDLLKPISFDHEVDYIIHAAGNAHPAAFNTDPVGTIVGNILGTYRLLEYAETHGARRFCYLSSGEVYGQGEIPTDTFEENFMGPVNLMSARSCYPESKRAAENLCASYYQQKGLETVIARPCHTYGPWITESDNRANVQFFRNVLQGEDILLKSAGAQMRSYAYIADGAAAILTVLLKGEAGQAYNCANPMARTTIAGLAQMIAAHEGRKVVFSDPSAADLANRSPVARQVLDTQKLESLGWKGYYTVEKGIDHTLSILKTEILR